MIQQLKSGVLPKEDALLNLAATGQLSAKQAALLVASPSVPPAAALPVAPHRGTKASVAVMIPLLAHAFR